MILPTLKTVKKRDSNLENCVPALFIWPFKAITTVKPTAL